MAMNSFDVFLFVLYLFCFVFPYNVSLAAACKRIHCIGLYKLSFICALGFDLC